jgi:uncharacterized protein (TIGR00730 family)
MHRTFKRLCVYCGSSAGNRPEYTDAAYAMGVALGAGGIELVYGGGRAGLMGAVAAGALKAGARVTGVIPEALMARELGNEEISELIVVPNMHVRKNRMAELADGFIALPGGWGTMEELTEMLTWLQLDFHQKPIGVLNVAGYYDHLFAFAQTMSESGFVRPEHRRLYCVDTDPTALLEKLALYDLPATPRWEERQALTPHQRALGAT